MAAQCFSKLPPSEVLWMTVSSKSGEVFYITSKQNRDAYFIYKQLTDSVARLGKGKSPDELEKKYIQ